MASRAQNLETARNNIAAIIAQITASPKPNYSVDGESISWADYLRTLTEQLREIDKLADGPYEVRSRVIT